MTNFLHFKRIALVPAATLALMGAVNPASAHEASAGPAAANLIEEQPAQESPSADLSDGNDIQIALEQAFTGDTSSLIALLHGPSGDETRLQLSERLHERNDFDVPLSAGDPISPELLRTGEYDIVCTGYNGVSMGWVDKVVLACHGWLDYYISGRHVAHYCPDLLPTAPKVTAACVAGSTGVFSALVTAPASITVGSAVWGIGLIVSVNQIRIGCGPRGSW